MSGKRGASETLRNTDQRPNEARFPGIGIKPESEARRPEAEEKIATGYLARMRQLQTDESALRERVNRLANLRLLAFALAVALAVVAGWRWTLWPLIGTIVFLAIFIALIRRHGVARLALRRSAGLLSITKEELARLDRDWDQIPLHHRISAQPDHPYAVDLDIFGTGSLFHLLDTPRTAAGVETLGEWLSSPASAESTVERQAAVSELAANNGYREAVLLQARELPDEPDDIEPFLDWAQRATTLSSRSGIIWLARTSPILLILSIVAEATGLLATPIWPIFLGINIVLLWLAGRSATAELEPVARLGGKATSDYAELLAHAATLEPASPRLQQLIQEIGGSDQTAARALRSLQRRTRLALPPDAWANIILQIAVLWDIHLLAMLEGWQRANGQSLRGWMQALGEIEALVALAGLAHNHPGWAMPAVDQSSDRLRASELGHPLLPPGRRVDNDVEVGPAGTLLLVTGSNMSGKSTLLRAIGVNAVLAQAGAPACAVALSLPPLDVWTSMRVQDSLNQGVSYFMAELRRLKLVVDAASLERHSRPVLYLLDEILHGTNPVERQIAARRIIRRLVASDSIGAVSTHDLALADDPLLGERARLVHFRETVSSGGPAPAMTFDYTLRPGLATSQNALRLLEIIGLGDPEDSTPDDPDATADRNSIPKATP